MMKFADLPVQRKLHFAMMLCSVSALLLACGAFMMFEFMNSSRSLQQTVTTLGRVMADNSTAAVAFEDRPAAEEILNSLRAEPQITAAALYDLDGRLFASYESGAAGGLPGVAPEELGLRDSRGVVAGTFPIQEGSLRLGTVFLQASKRQMVVRLTTDAMVTLVVLISAILLAWLVASSLRRSLARPILELARTAEAISVTQDFSLRAHKYGGDEFGKLTGVFNSLIERTGTAVQALRESEERFRRMADGAPVLIWMTDEHGKCTWFNQRWLDFVGAAMSSEVGYGWTRHVHPDSRGERVAGFERVMRAREMLELEYRLRRHDGEYRWMSVTGQPRYEAGGKFTGYIGVCIDVSDRRAAQQEMARARDEAVAASKAKDEFLAALSHELRTPLNPVLVVASEAAQDPSLAPEVRENFELIARNVGLEARLIDDLLDLTRITRGKLTLDLRPVDIHVILRDALLTALSDITSKHITVETRFNAEQHVVEGDSVRLQQVFWNVVSNAVKFTPPGGSISVSSRWLEADRLLVVTVTDSGIGLTAAELARIFDAFVQGDHAEGTSTHRFGGMGLGLAISKMMVGLHGGSIAASSAGRGQGATFVVELPTTEKKIEVPSKPPLEMPAANAESRADPASSPATGEISVLLVEDHESTRRALEIVLKRRRLQVDTAGSLAEARQRIGTGKHYDLLISDIGLPDGDGYTLLRELRRSGHDVTGIALSGYGMEEDLSRSRQAGFSEHLIKPINVRELDQMLERRLGSRNGGRPT